MDKCTDRLVADAEAASDAEKEQIHRYAEETYCSRFAERGWVYGDGTLSIEAHKWLEEGGEEVCMEVEVEAGSEGEPAESATTVPCEELGEDPVIDCAFLHHVRESEVRDYVEELRRRQGNVECDDGTPLAELGAP